MELDAPSDGLLKSINDHIKIWRRISMLLLSVKWIPPDLSRIKINKWSIKCVMCIFIHRERNSNDEAAIKEFDWSSEGK